MHVESDYNEGTMEDATENEGDDVDSLNDLDLSGYDMDNIPLNFGGNDNFLSNEDLDLFFDNIYDVAYPATEIRDTEDVLETTPPTSNQMADTTTPKEKTSGIPPLEDVIPTTEPSVSKLLTTQTSQPPLESRRRDLRQGVFIPEQS